MSRYSDIGYKQMASMRELKHTIRRIKVHNAPHSVVMYLDADRRNLKAHFLADAISVIGSNLRRSLILSYLLLVRCKVRSLVLLGRCNPQLLYEASVVPQSIGR